jgi:Raf kinase inhibitor-like YbhB/YbcL family protein
VFGGGAGAAVTLGCIARLTEEKTMAVQRRTHRKTADVATATIGALFVVAMLTACDGPSPEATPTPDAPGVSTGETFLLSSSDADADGYLPDTARGNVAAYCGDGDNVSPALDWIGAPDDTASFVLLMTDPESPSFVHWVVTGIPGDTTYIDEAKDGKIDVGVVGTNSRGAGNYVGPCVADRGYAYTLYALDTLIEGDASTTLDEATALMDGHVLQEATIVLKRR